MPRTRGAAKKTRSKPELEFTRTLTPAVSKRQTRSAGSKSALQKKVGESYRQKKKATSDVLGKKASEEIVETSIPYDQENEANDEPEIIKEDTFSYIGVDSISKEEALKQLREFDFTYKYGPATSITRLQRFYRAERCGLNPPSAVRDIIERFVKVDESVNLSVWSAYPL